MKIVESIVTQGHGYLNADYICIHETANPGATALNHVNYWRNNPTYAVHYVADWTPSIYHCVPNDRLCWQVGNGNGRVIGIELCHAQNKNDFNAVWNNGVEWAAWILKQKGWGVDKLISHDDARRWWGGTDHTDPIGYFAAYGKTFNDFKNDVNKLLVKGGIDMTREELRQIATEVWSYWNKKVENRGDAYLILRDTNTKAANMPLNVWSYWNKNVEKRGDAYGILRKCLDGIERIEKQLASIDNKLK